MVNARRSTPYIFHGLSSRFGLLLCLMHIASVHAGIGTTKEDTPLKHLAIVCAGAAILFLAMMFARHGLRYATRRAVTDRDDGSCTRHMSNASLGGSGKVSRDITAMKSQKSCLRGADSHTLRSNHVCFSVGSDIEAQADVAVASQEPTAKPPEETPEVVIEVIPEEGTTRPVENSQTGEASTSVQDVCGGDEDSKDSKEDSKRLKKERKSFRLEGSTGSVTVSSVSLGDNHGEGEDSKEGAKKVKKDSNRKSEKDRKSHAKSKSKPSGRAA